MKKKITTSILLLIFTINIAMPAFADDNPIDMRIYIKQRPTQNETQNYHGAKFEPKIGCYLGMFAEGDKKVHNAWTGSPFYFDGVPKLMGKKHAMYMVYIHYGMEFNHYASHYKKAKERNCGMQIALEPNNGLDKVQNNEYLHKFAKQIKETDIPIFLRFANEMNDPGNPWGKDKKLYIEKFRLVADIMHKEAPNVAMCWSPNDWGHNGFGDAAEWYPGDKYVDWIGVSSYPPYLENGESKHKTKFTDRLSIIYNAYSDRKPIYLSEGAPIQNVEFKTTDVSTVAAKDLKEFYDEIARRFPGIKAVFYWDNSETFGAARQCILSTNSLVLKAYKKATADKFFLSNIGDKSPVIYKDLSSFNKIEIKPRYHFISTYVGNHSLKTNKVAYYINDKYIGETVGSPYTIGINFLPYQGQTIKIKADSYALDGKYIATKIIEVKVSKRTKDYSIKPIDKTNKNLK